MDAHLKDCLVDRGRDVMRWGGLEALKNYRHHGGACGCLGPQDGEPHCNCVMSSLLEKHLVLVLNEIDPPSALHIMRSRLIAALSL